MTHGIEGIRPKAPKLAVTIGRAFQVLNDETAALKAENLRLKLQLDEKNENHKPYQQPDHSRVPTWHCKRCDQDVDYKAFRCGCVTGPSPWYVKSHDQIKRTGKYPITMVNSVWELWSKDSLRKEILDRMTHFYYQTDEKFKFPNSAEGDLLKMAYYYLQPSVDGVTPESGCPFAEKL